MTHEEIEAAIKRLRELEEKKSYLAREVMRALIGRDFPDLYGNIGTLKALLRQADPDTHMLLPVDANGVPIHIGDELCGYGYPDGGVYCMAINGADVIFVAGVGMSYKDMLLWSPKECRHYHAPTIEELLREYANKLLAWHNDSDPSDSAGDELALVVKYAAKLREVMADDDEAR